MWNRMKRLPESELEIMMILWKKGGAMNRMEIEAQLKKEVAAPTVLSFLNRLEAKGFVRVEKVGKLNWYTPLVRENDYLRRESRNILQKLYRNSIRNFMAALYDGDGPSREELEELQAFLDEKSGSGNLESRNIKSRELEEESILKIKSRELEEESILKISSQELQDEEREKREPEKDGGEEERDREGGGEGKGDREGKGNREGGGEEEGDRERDKEEEGGGR